MDPRHDGNSPGVIKNIFDTQKVGISNLAFTNDIDGTKQEHFEQFPSAPVNRKSSVGVVSLPAEKAPRKTKYGRQIFAAFAANMGSMAFGSVLAWTSPALPDIRKSGDFDILTKTQESWIGSIMLLGAGLACPLSGLLMEKLGRKMSMIILTFPLLGGWFCIYFARSLVMIYVGRFITGFCSGSYTVFAPVYVSETSNPAVRGALMTGFNVMLNGGILFMYIVGTYASWRVQCLISAALPVLAFLLLLFAPESPRYLVEKGKELEAKKALGWLNGNAKLNCEQVEHELENLKLSVQDSRSRKISWKDLTARPVLKPTVLCMILMAFNIFSGIDAIIFYTVDIFRSSGSDLNENLCTNIVGAFQVIATISSALLVDRCGRRILLLLSSTFIVISLTSMGVYFYLKALNGEVPPEKLGFLPLLSLIVYVIAFCTGIGPVPWIIMGEIVPSHVKGLTAGIITIFLWLLSFGVTLTFQDLIGVIGPYGAFWFFAGISFLGIIYVALWIPETKGKSLDEIEKNFRKI